jgi:hypothetical protein
VKKDNGTLYWYDLKGRVIEETDLNGNLVNDYIYALGMRLARRDAAGNVYTYLNDPLGSPRVILDPSQSVCYEGDFLPFGEEQGSAESRSPETLRLEVRGGYAGRGAIARGRWVG